MHRVPRRLIAMAMEVIDSSCLLYTSLLSVGKQKQRKESRYYLKKNNLFGIKDTDYLRIHQQTEERKERRGEEVEFCATM